MVSKLSQGDVLKQFCQKIDLKLKNTKRALNISKTLFGMVDEMDSIDFSALNDNA